MLLDFAVYGVFILLLVSLAVGAIILIHKNQKLQEISLKVALEKYTIAKQLEKLMLENESKKLEKDDGFIRFLSQSRESAFTYIEEVQEAIAKYSIEQTPENYEKLISFLPSKDEK
jgi:predicted Holliday junction resolvase-like endonuclease